MSFRSIVPLVRTHLTYAQSGRDIVTVGTGDFLGHGGGHGGATAQSYIELLAGSECGKNTSEQNSTGTRYFPDIPYWGQIYNLSTDISDSSLVELEVTASSLVGDDLAKPLLLGGLVEYNPDLPVSHYMHIFHGDIIVGKFKRIAVFKVADSDQKGRLILTRGVR